MVETRRHEVLQVTSEYYNRFEISSEHLRTHERESIRRRKSFAYNFISFKQTTESYISYLINSLDTEAA